jgi:2-keto-4-pentenoate hydratase/2-oxohepta-3-ene-1,7-dioic acid hydratase in catechol pathway
MRLVNAGGRLALLVQGRVLDIERASQGVLPSTPAQLYPRWAELAEWAARGDFGGVVDTALGGTALGGTALGDTALGDTALEDTVLGPPSPEPRQVFAIGLNYREHAAEGGMDLPDTPMVFTKFPSCIAGSYDEIVLPPGAVDYEAELVVVIGPVLVTPDELADPNVRHRFVDRPDRAAAAGAS